MVKAGVCKTPMCGFESHPRLSLNNYEAITMSVLIIVLALLALLLHLLLGNN